MNDSILRYPQLKQIIHLSRTTIWRMEKKGEFPKRIQLSPRSVGWRMSELQTWLADCESVKSYKELSSKKKGESNG